MARWAAPVAAIALLVMLHMPVQAAAGELTQRKKDFIDELLALTGANDVSDTMISFYLQNMSAMLRRAHPDIDEQAFAVLESEVLRLVR